MTSNKRVYTITMSINRPGQPAISVCLTTVTDPLDPAFCREASRLGTWLTAEWERQTHAEHAAFGYKPLIA